MRGIGVHPRASHLAADGEGPALLQFVDARNDKHVVAPQLHVRGTPRHDAPEVQRQKLQRQVLALTKKLRAAREGVALQALGALDQGPHRVHLVAQLVHPLPVHRAADLHAVGEAVQNGSHSHRVSVLQRPSAEIALPDVVEPVFAPRLADHPELLRVGVPREAARVVQQTTQRLASFHLVVHRTLHLPRDVDQQLVGAHDHHVALFQTHVVVLTTLQQVGVHVHARHLTAPAHHADIAKPADRSNPSRAVQRMEDRRKRRQTVSPGRLDLSHHVHLDRA